MNECSNPKCIESAVYDRDVSLTIIVLMAPWIPALYVRYPTVCLSNCIARAVNKNILINDTFPDLEQIYNLYGISNLNRN